MSIPPQPQQPSQQNFIPGAGPPQPPPMQQQQIGGIPPQYQQQGSYGSNQNITQYNQQQQQPIYVSSNSSQSLNHHMEHGTRNSQNGPIYVASNIGVLPGLPTSASNNSVGVYGQQQTIPPQPIPPIGYGQTNGSTGVYGNPAQIIAGQVPIPPPMAPQAPPPPPAGFTNSSPPQPPAAPPAPAMPINTGGPPPPAPPPPPPMGGLGKPEGLDMNSLASQLQAAKLKRNQKTTPPPAENSGSSTSSGGSGNYGTIGRSSNGMASMMDEMAKTLARRRAVVDKKPEVCLRWFFGELFFYVLLFCSLNHRAKNRRIYGNVLGRNQILYHIN